MTNSERRHLEAFDRTFGITRKPVDNDESKRWQRVDRLERYLAAWHDDDQADCN